MDIYENAEALNFTDEELKKVKISKIRLDDLVVTFGHIVVCDPLVQPEKSFLPVAIPIGKYPVELYQSNDLVGFVDIRFRDEVVSKWIFEDFSVDAGYAAVMDLDAREALLQHEEKLQEEMGDEYISYYDDVFTEINPDDNDYFSYNPISTIKANVVVFRSGYGDGVYVAWIGLNEKNECVRIVVDVGTISNSDGRSESDIETDNLMSSLSEKQKVVIKDAHRFLEADDVSSLVKLLDEGVITVETYIADVGANLIFEAIRLNKYEALVAMINRATTMRLPEYLMIEDKMTTYLEYALFLKKRPKAEIMKLLQEKA